ncbi:MAG: YjbQ family protein [Solirubrobacterales bacterium]|nr:YjbQ family protein [Solirubrobacterales bacterium]
MWLQREIELRPRPRGFHLVTDEVVDALQPELRDVGVGLLHVHILHTSASLTLNENASPDVRRDFETWVDHAVPEDFAWTHTLEGADDMPAHVKASIMGPSLTLPVARGRLALGTWQGIYLCEHRDRGGARSLVATLNGERA